jgi:Uma2 family endonuclease
MNKKQVFYDRHEVEEYYLYDLERNDFSGWMRSQGRLDVIDAIGKLGQPPTGNSL